MSSELYEEGLRHRRRVLGDDYVDRALAGADAFNEEFQQILTEYCWGQGVGSTDADGPGAEPDQTWR